MDTNTFSTTKPLINLINKFQILNDEKSLITNILWTRNTSALSNTNPTVQILEPT